MNFPSKEFIENFKKTPGAISVCESIAIAWLGSKAPRGTYIDLGSNAGKAAMSAAYGIMPEEEKSIIGGRLIEYINMVDPIYDLTNLEAFKHSVQGKPENVPWGYVFDPGFKDKINKRITTISGMTPFFVGDYSLSAIEKYNDYGYVFIDSDDHQPELVMEEVRLLEDKMIKGGIIAFHDFRNQYHGPYEGYQYLLSTGKYESIEIPWDEIRAYVSENNLEEGNDSWHMPDDKLPCFVGALRRK
jgi:hypothetical protein